MESHQAAFGPFVLDRRLGLLRRNGERVVIGDKALVLLTALLQAKGQVVTKAELMEAAWPGTFVEESNLSVQIAALRKLLGPTDDGGGWIATVPRVGYRFVGPGDVDPQALPALQDRNAPGHGERPTIAVLPFSNIERDREHEYLVDGITEDVITALTRFRWFSVVARNSVFVYKDTHADVRQIARDLGVRYLLEGSVRASGDRVRVSSRLIDATTGTDIWTERYDLSMNELFALQDDIAERLAGAIEPELLKSEAVLAVTRESGNSSAWGLVRKGTWYFHQVGRATHLKARELFRMALQADPQLPDAHLWLARVNAGLLAYGWSGDPASDRAEGRDAAISAIQLDARNPYAHYSLAIVSAYSGDFSQARRAAEKAIELNSSFALGHLVLGMALLFDGNAEGAKEPLERGIALSPYDPQNFVWFALLALAYLFSGDAEIALRQANRCLDVRPGWKQGLEILACCYAALDAQTEARDVVAGLEGIPFSPDNILAPLLARNPEWAGHLQSLLRKAVAGNSDQ